MKDKEVKESAREDKRNWLEEKAAENGRNRELYNMTKAIVGERKRQELGVRNKQGELKTEAREKLQRWVEHFSEILNRDDPTNPVEEYRREEADEIEEIDLGRWRVQEVKNALMSLFHHLNYEPSVPQLGKVTAINKQTTIWRNFGGHSPVAGLTRLHDRCTKPKASLIPPLTWE